MTLVLDDRIAIVTGASKGVGRGIARSFAAEGAHVILTARTTIELDRLAAEVRAKGQRASVITADLARPADIAHIVDTTMAKFGRIDVLVNNAAMMQPRLHLVDLPPEIWREIIEVNITAPAMLIRAVLPAMIANRWGKIINISSLGGRRGGKGRSAYRVTKAAMINLTESVAAEVGEFGINVNCICPADVFTEGYRMSHPDGGKHEPAALMRPEDIAAVAMFLASDAATSIKGASIDVGGDTNPLLG